MDRREQEENSSGPNDNMIKTIKIQNFKSIKHLEIDAKRVNVFIGEPNTGKSNILESLGFFSAIAGYFFTLKEAIRVERPVDLVFNNEVKEKIVLKIKDTPCIIECQNVRINIKYQDISFNIGGPFSNSLPKIPDELVKEFENIKFYKFKIRETFPVEKTDFLLPSGENLLMVLYTNSDARKIASEILKNYGIILNLKPLEKKIGVSKVKEEAIVVELPYILLSDTLQRLIYYICAIESNEKSVLIFEEPESHAFPYYTKYLAEKISYDIKNQYFITTHNPYFLLSLIEKTPKKDIGVFITYMKEGETKVKSIPEEKLDEIMDYEKDIFLNLENFLK